MTDPWDELEAECRARVRVCAAAAPTLSRWLERYLLAHPLPPLARLPAATWAVARGGLRGAAPVTAAWAVTLVGARWMDDAADGDRPDELRDEVGLARAHLLGVAAIQLSWRVLAEAGLSPRALAWWAERALRVADGQDADLRADAPTVRAAWEVARAKTGALYALGAGGGALAAGAPLLRDACGAFGEELGLLVQLLDDLDGALELPGEDLVRRRPTLAVRYGLAADTAARGQFAAWFASGDADVTVGRALLEAAGTRAFLVDAAAGCHARATRILGGLPAGLGRDALAEILDTAAHLPGPSSGPKPKRQGSG